MSDKFSMRASLLRNVLILSGTFQIFSSKYIFGAKGVFSKSFVFNTALFLCKCNFQFFLFVFFQKVNFIKYKDIKFQEDLAFLDVFKFVDVADSSQLLSASFSCQGCILSQVVRISALPLC